MATNFTAAFLEQRMAEHKRWAHEVEYALIEEIIDEVQELPKRKPKTGWLFTQQMTDELRLAIVNGRAQMTLLTELESPSLSVSTGGGISGENSALAFQWSEFCTACLRTCTFAAFGSCDEGLLVECTGCGVPRVAYFSRMNSEVA